MAEYKFSFVNDYSPTFQSLRHSFAIIGIGWLGRLDDLPAHFYFYILGLGFTIQRFEK